jgi:O-antigen/teichoic acid export membrane protein
MKVLRDLWYAPLLAAAMVLMMARLLILARLLPVEVFAALSGGLLASGTFCMLGCIGLQSMLQRDWPVHIVRGRELRGLVLAAQCNLTAIAAALVAVLATSLAPPIAGFSAGVLVVGIVHGLSQQMFLIATVESRSRGDSIRYAWENVGRAVATVALASAVALAGGSALWILAVEAIVSLLLASFFFQRTTANAAEALGRVYALAFRGLRRINWVSAITLMVIASLSFLIVNADRWVAANLLDAKSFGIYAFAWIVLLAAQAAQAVINASLYPLLARTFAAQGRRGAFRICCRSSLGLLAAGIVCAIPAWFLFEWAIARWFQDYATAVAIVPIFVAVALLRVSDFWSSYLLIIGEERRLLVLNCAAALAGTGVWLVMMRPWSVSVGIRDVALLPVCLATIAYLSTVLLSLRARNADELA